MWSVQKVFPQAKNINCVLDMYVVCDIEFKFRRFFPNKVKFLQTWDGPHVVVIWQWLGSSTDEHLKQFTVR